MTKYTNLYKALEFLSCNSHILNTIYGHEEAERARFDLVSFMSRTNELAQKELKKEREDNRLVKEIENILGSDIMTTKEIGDKLGISTQKVAYLIKKNSKKFNKTSSPRKVEISINLFDFTFEDL